MSNATGEQRERTGAPSVSLVPSDRRQGWTGGKGSGGIGVVVGGGGGGTGGRGGATFGFRRTTFLRAGFFVLFFALFRAGVRLRAGFFLVAIKTPFYGRWDDVGW